MSMVTHMHQNRSIVLEQEEVYYCILACYYLSTLVLRHQKKLSKQTALGFQEVQTILCH